MYMQHWKHALWRHVPKTRLQGPVWVPVQFGFEFELSLNSSSNYFFSGGGGRVRVQLERSSLWTGKNLTWIIEGSLEVKLPTIWTDEKQSRAEAERREKIRRERVRRKKMQMREKVGKSQNTVFFQWFEAPQGRKVSSLKRRVRRHLARWEI